jgi:hypothetical protein
MSGPVNPNPGAVPWPVKAADRAAFLEPGRDGNSPRPDKETTPTGAIARRVTQT